MLQIGAAGDVKRNSCRDRVTLETAVRLNHWRGHSVDETRQGSGIRCRRVRMERAH
jgi:hypothetical protein